MTLSAPDSSYVDCPIRVRYAETDRMGVAYYANYLVWFEVGRTEYCRQKGFTYAEMERETDRFLMVVEAHCRYRRSVTYDDALLVRTWIRQLKRRKVIFGYHLVREQDGAVAAVGETQHLVTDRAGRPSSFPESYLDLLRR